MIKIKNDPFSILIQAFSELWPDKTCEIEFSNDIPQPTINDLDDRDFWFIEKNDIVRIGAAGATRFKNGEIPLILLNPDLELSQIVDTLAEELAHVAVGKEAGHGNMFEYAMDKLFIKFNELAEGINNEEATGNG